MIRRPYSQHRGGDRRSNLRRAGSLWTPAQLSANGVLWLRADDTSDPVASWPDRYNSYDPAQGTGTRQPAKTTGPNGQAVVDFDGASATGDVLVSATALGSNLAAYTFTTVFNRDPEKSHNGFFGLDATPANHGNNTALEFYVSTAAVLSIVHNRASGIKFIQPSQAASGISNAGTWCVLTIIWESGNRPAIYINGTKTVDAVTDATWTDIISTGCYPVVGLGNDSTIGYHNDGIAETVLLNTALSGDNLTNHHAYFASRYAL